MKTQDKTQIVYPDGSRSSDISGIEVGESVFVVGSMVTDNVVSATLIVVKPRPNQARSAGDIAAR